MRNADDLRALADRLSWWQGAVRHQLLGIAEQIEHLESEHQQSEEILNDLVQDSMSAACAAQLVGRSVPGVRHLRVINGGLAEAIPPAAQAMLIPAEDIIARIRPIA